MAVEEYTDSILNIPSEYVPGLVVLLFIIGLGWTLMKCRALFNAQDKEVARKNGGALTYSVNYLELNFAAAVVTVIAGLILIGGAIGQGFIILDSWIDVFAIGSVVGCICAVMSDYFLRLYGLESLRDGNKADEARAEHKSETEQ